MANQDKVERFIDKFLAWQEASERISAIVSGRTEAESYRALRLRGRELGSISRMSDVEWQEFQMIVGLIANLERILPDEVYDQILRELKR